MIKSTRPVALNAIGIFLIVILLFDLLECFAFWQRAC